MKRPSDKDKQGIRRRDHQDIGLGPRHSCTAVHRDLLNANCEPVYIYLCQKEQEKGIANTNAVRLVPRWRLIFNCRGDHDQIVTDQVPPYSIGKIWWVELVFVGASPQLAPPSPPPALPCGALAEYKSKFSSSRLPLLALITRASANDLPQQMICQNVSYLLEFSSSSEL